MIRRFIKEIIKFVIAVTNWTISFLSFPFDFFLFMFITPSLQLYYIKYLDVRQVLYKK